MPFKFQLLSFHVYQCHHRGVERGGEDEAFRLPSGFSKTKRVAMCATPNHVRKSIISRLVNKQANQAVLFTSSKKLTYHSLKPTK